MNKPSTPLFQHNLQVTSGVRMFEVVVLESLSMEASCTYFRSSVRSVFGFPHGSRSHARLDEVMARFLRPKKYFFHRIVVGIVLVLLVT